MANKAEVDARALHRIEVLVGGMGGMIDKADLVVLTDASLGKSILGDLRKR